ncbi:MAG: hypothetical protein HKN37_14595 [Rhodothermales bacterium]|nr:hypothetical protein [Rhodothermales bacterium]
MIKRVRSVALLTALLSVSSASVTPHKFHATYARMAVEDGVAACEIRFFKHDLEDAITKHHKLAGYSLSPELEQDSLFVTYLNRTFTVMLNDTLATASLAGSGEETVGHEEMWWYLVTYDAGETIKKLSVTNRLLFELFDDQRNILRLQHFPSAKRETFYFVSDSDHHEAAFPS